MTRFAASVVAVIGEVMIRLRHGGAEAAAVTGAAPSIPRARAQGVPTLKMPTARGWAGDERPVAAPGLAVNAFARGLRHPRWMLVLDNGDVLVAESVSIAGGVHSLRDYAMKVTMQRAAATGKNANRISLLRDADGDGVAEARHDYLTGLNQPFGMAQLGETLYVGNTDALVAFDFQPGATALKGPGRRLYDMKPAGHWTRSLLPSADGTRLYIGVGSQSNIGDDGMKAEEGRAAIHEFDLTTGKGRLFAAGLRNPVGMAWEPEKGSLWTVVNERDGLGDETPPDYLTEVQEGAFYGWPYSYWGGIVDDRVPQAGARVARAPDYALGGHTASLGLCWLPEGVLPGFGAGMVIGQHGSWNRSRLSGYRVIHVPFAGGRPSGPPRDILTGFLSDDEKFARGRPVGVSLGAGGLLVADDVGNVVWRVTGG